MTPSQLARRPKAHRKRPPQERYSVSAYRRAIARGCEQRAIADRMLEGLSRQEAKRLVKDEGFTTWHPNQLRHNAATRLRREFGLDVARVVLGHRSPAVTEIYAEVDREKALRVMSQVG